MNKMNETGCFYDATLIRGVVFCFIVERFSKKTFMIPIKY